MKRVAVVLTGLVGVAMISGCATTPTVPVVTDSSSAGSMESPLPVPKPTPTPTPIPTPTGPVAPLTGLRVFESSIGPALCIKIENSPEARPQLGLNSADIVYEEVVEGGITRFMGVFQSTIPTSVEPVRSLRPMDPNIALPFNCALIFSGGQTAFLNAAAATGIQLMYMDRGDPGFARDTDTTRVAPHNVVGDMATFISKVNPAKNNGTNPTPPAWAFADSADQSTAGANGTATTTLTAVMSSGEIPHWTWDAKSGTWLRFEALKPAMTRTGADDSTATQIAASNVVAISVKVANTKYRDPAGSPVPETVVNNSSGTGTLASDGKSVPIKWSKAGASDPIVLTDDSGNPVTLTPGNTWVELVPTSGSITTA